MARQQTKVEPVSSGDVSEEDVLRARFYGMLAHLLTAPPKDETLRMLRNLDGDDATDMGRALSALAAVATKISVEQAAEEYGALFIGVVQGELLPYASYYLTGFLHEKPLANLRGDLERLGVSRTAATKEPEDHIGILFEIMHGLITGAFGAPVDLLTQRQFFETHIRPWAPRMFGDLEKAKSAVLYMPIGAVGQVFLAIETEGFEMVA